MKTIEICFRANKCIIELISRLIFNSNSVRIGARRSTDSSVKNRRWKKEAIIKIGRRFSYHRRNHRWEREPWRPVCVLGMRATSERERVNQRWSVRFFARPVHWHSATLSKINIEASPLPAHRQKNFERCSIRLLIDSRHPRNFRSNTRTRACSVERPLKNRLSGGNWVDGKGRFRMHALY